jgi:hypothetical protein
MANPQSNDLPPITPLFRVNAETVNGVGPGYWPTSNGGLSLFLSAGTAFNSGSYFDWPGGTLTLTDNSTNYVYLDGANNCNPNSNTIGFNTLSVPIAIVNTSGGNITAIRDLRTFFVPQGTTTTPPPVNETPIAFYDIACTFDGTMLDSQIMIELPMVRPISFAANMVPSRGYTNVVSTNPALFSIRKNNVEFGQMTFPNGANIAVFTGTATGLSIGDVLTVIAPSPNDPTLADLGFILSALTQPDYQLSLSDVLTIRDAVVTSGGFSTIALALSDNETGNWQDYVPSFTQDYNAGIAEDLSMTDGTPHVTTGATISININ